MLGRHRDDCQGQQDEREGQHDVDQSHDAPVHPSPEVARSETHQHANGGGEQDRGDPDHQRDPPSVDHSREEIAPDLVRAERVLDRATVHPRRRGQAVADVDLQWFVRRDPRCEHRRGHDQQHDHGGSETPLEPPEAA
jgi:hypothetical protein